ncbi:hypothetical protein J8G26_14555 [Acidovorax sp. JG5]|uniref:hypothetical protein n=1 Tax=Acidovorax sp. JG5 TaxID=2822718 RepID=UPI001B329178|nr:hypothetical protein [Acidovorax sp. JG5]MBP3981947.1 hypothetical protein [Acidovorax sp. JG5]
MIEFIVGLVVFALILIVSVTNKGDLNRYPEIKNKRRFSDKHLRPDELAELEKFARKQPLAQAERQRQGARARSALRSTFSPTGPWRPAVVARLPRTLGNHRKLLGHTARID